MSAACDPRPLIAHVVYRFDVGGLENGVVNLINHLDPHSFRHAVIALTGITEFSRRLRRSDVQCVALNKPPGHGVKIYPAFHRLMRELRPAIVHTRNLAALETSAAAWAAGVPVRIHGEHGRDVEDLDGGSVRHQWIRRLYRPFVTRYVAVSKDLGSYLTAKVGVPPARVHQIYNGVDAQRFRPAAGTRALVPGWPFDSETAWVVGTVGRMETVKDQLTLARAFMRALVIEPAMRARLRLVMVGEGPLQAQVKAMLAAAGLAELAWLPGARSDIPAILQRLDCFVLPSIGEGISNTILEAMASGLPVIATNVGGNPELIEPGRTGELLAPADHEQMAHKILAYARDPQQACAFGQAGRARVERLFSLEAMIDAYQALYTAQLESAAPRLRRIGAA